MAFIERDITGRHIEPAESHNAPKRPVDPNEIITIDKGVSGGNLRVRRKDINGTFLKKYFSSEAVSKEKSAAPAVLITPVTPATPTSQGRFMESVPTSPASVPAAQILPGVVPASRPTQLQQAPFVLQAPQPAGAFGGYPASQQPYYPVPMPAPPVAPTKKLRISGDGLPFTAEFYYHDIIRSGDALILVFDSRAQGYPKAFPAAMQDSNGELKKLTFQCEQDDSVKTFRGIVTGIEFSYDHRQFAILIVEDA